MQDFIDRTLTNTALAVLGLLVTIAPRAQVNVPAEELRVSKDTAEFARRQGASVPDGATIGELTLRMSEIAPKLTLPPTPSQFDPKASPAMALYRPDGPVPANGRFPALVLMHTCGHPSSDTQLHAWTRDALARGYVVLVVDSWSQRGVSDYCGIRSNIRWTPGAVRAGDAFDALAHLRRLDYVDSDRIGLAGFSQGSWAAFRVASRNVTEAFLPSGRGFAAAVASYGPCRLVRPVRVDLIVPDVAAPLFVMMGEDDDEAHPKVCTPILELAKSRGAPVEWYVVPGAYHAWDNEMFRARRSIPVPALGTVATYEYSARAAEDSRKRGLDFLDRHLKRAAN